MATSLPVIFKEIAKAKNKDQKKELILKYDCVALREILRHAFDPNIKFILPPGAPPIAKYQGDIQELVYQGKELEIPTNSEIIIKNQGLEKEIKAWAEKGVSPSALNKYNTCSLQFYYHYLAKIRTDEQVDEYADASTMGTAIHDALDRNYPLDILTPQFIKNNTKVILQQIKDGFTAALSEQGMQEGKNYLSLKV